MSGQALTLQQNYVPDIVFIDIISVFSPPKESGAMSCSSDDQSDKECPLCMEQLEIDDVDFYPCKCEYQICRFCWHRIRTNENGLCPACRQPYPEDPVNFKPLSTADLQRIKDEKKMKQQAEKLRISESRKHLANFRVLQKNLVYVVGLSQRVASEEALRKPEYFGRFGKIMKIVTGMSPSSGLPHSQGSHTAYVTYSKIEEALRAIQGVNNAQLDGRIVKASLGTTKYCSAYLRTQVCGKPDCMYLHDTADTDISFTKDDMHMGKHTDYEKRLIELMLNRRPQATEKRQPVWSSKNVCWEQNGNEITVEEPLSSVGVCSIDAEPPVEDPTPSEAFGLAERQNSHNKENQSQPSVSTAKCLTNGKHKSGSPTLTPPPPTQRTPSPPSEPTPPPLGVSEKEHVEEPAPSLDVPTITTDNTITESKFQRYMHMAAADSDGCRGSVPAPAPREEGPAPLMNWQTLLGLAPPSPTPSQTNITHSLFAAPMKCKQMTSPPPGLSSLFADDDLGFDPFSESTKGLAQLLEEERVRHPKHTSSSAATGFSSSQSSSLRDLWGRPSMFSSSLGQHHQQSHNSSSQLDMFGMPTQTNPGFTNGLQHNGFHDYTHHHHQSAYAPPPGLAPLSSRSSSQSHHSSNIPQSITEWQEGLKALLPNVNVRFASDMEQQQPAEVARWESSHSQMMSTHAIPPPPGFSVPNR